MERKYSYSEIKLAYFDNILCYYGFKFRDGFIEKWDDSLESASGFAQSEAPEFNHPLEQLMFKVIVIIENAGRDIPFHIIWLETIKKIIKEHTLEKLISDLTPEERQYENEGYGFLCDLNLVLNNQKLERE